MIWPRRFAPACAAFLLATLLFAACASVRIEEDIEDYQAAIAELQQKMARNPNDAGVARDLGIIYLRTNNAARANDLLQTAFSRNPDDPKTLFNLGLANETLGKYETALRLYEQYPDVSRPYRQLMAGRYAAVTQKMLRDAVQQRVRDEANLPAEPAEPRIVAVYPLDYQGSDPQYEPLGRGLAELITVDLSNVRALRLVERARLQALLDEIALAQGGALDPATAPRVGRLIGAGRLVGGVYNVLGGNDLRLDAALWEADRGAMPGLEAETGALRNFFTLEKRLVFSLLAEMGIEPSPEERQAIEFIPTQNLQAFLAYSRGLEREDAGAFGEAASFYEQAAQIDANFQAARQRAEAAGGMALAGGTVSDALAAAYQLDPSPPLATTPGVDPLANRLLLLNGSLGSSLLPGVDQRRPDDTCANVSCAGLPDPPDPPRVNGGN